MGVLVFEDLQALMCSMLIAKVSEAKSTIIVCGVDYRSWEVLWNPICDRKAAVAGIHSYHNLFGGMCVAESG